MPAGGGAMIVGWTSLMLAAWFIRKIFNYKLKAV